MIFENINNNMDALLEALRPSSQEVTGLSGKESFLANLEAKQNVVSVGKNVLIIVNRAGIVK